MGSLDAQSPSLAASTSALAHSLLHAATRRRLPSQVRRLLQHRDARLYIAGQVVSLIGDTTLWLGLGIWVKLMTGSASAAGLVFFVYSLAYLTAPASGLLVDRVRRRPLMLLVNLSSAAAILLLLLVQTSAELWLVYVVIALYGASGALLGSAQSALLTVLLPQELLSQANAALQTGRQGCRLIAPLVGAGVVAATGTAKPVAVFDAVSFTVAALTLWLLHVREPAPRPSEHHWSVEMVAGLRHVLATAALRQIVLATAVAMLVIGFAETIIFVVVQAGLHLPATFVGVLVAFQGVGAVAGALTTPRVIRRIGEGRTLAAGLSVFAVGDALLIPGYLPAAVIGIVIAGAGLPWPWSHSPRRSSAVHRRFCKDERTRLQTRWSGSAASFRGRPIRLPARRQGDHRPETI
jgi:MFS family permease